MFFYMIDARTTIFLQIGGRIMAKNKKAEENLKGTLYLTFAVGAAIILVWAYCFSLFMDRF